MIAGNEDDNTERSFTTEEYERMLSAAKKAVPSEDLKDWQFLMNAMWLSGIRLSEAMQLTWSRTGVVAIIERRPGIFCLSFKPEGQKNNKRQIIPCIPEMSDLLNSVPKSERTGFAINVLQDEQPGPRKVKVREVIKSISKAASVSLTPGVEDWAKPHDYRRSFVTKQVLDGVSPFLLQKVARHENIQTTLKYYLHLDLDGMLDTMYDRQGHTDYRPDTTAEKRFFPR